MRPIPTSEAEAFQEYRAIKEVKRGTDFDDLPPRAKLLRYSVLRTDSIYLSMQVLSILSTYLSYL
jgi:hypothetical protein